MKVGDRVRFTQRYGTGVLVDGGPWVDAGYEAKVLEVDGDRGAMVRMPCDGMSVRQMVPQTVLEVIEP